MSIRSEYEHTLTDMIEVGDQFIRPQAVNNIGRMFKNMATDQDDYAWLTFMRDREIRSGIAVVDGAFKFSYEGRTGPPRADPRKAGAEAGKLIRRFSTTPYYMTSDMVTRMMEWLEGANLKRTIPEYLVPTETGFLRFEGGLTVTDIDGDFIMQDILVWGPHPLDPSRLVTFWLLDTENPLSVKAFIEILGKRLPDVTPEQAKERLVQLAGGRYLLDTYSFMSFDSTVPFGPEANQQYSSQVTCALFMLMAQPLAGVTGIPSNTNWIRKTAKRKGFADEVNVIYLRREVARDPELRDLLKGHGSKKRRHRVRAHWATYWVKDEDGQRVAVKRKRREHFRGSGETVVKDEFFRVSR